ncbi:uncharacterized protein LOC123549807 [Mercenaria mercenaria]|uniref:uncharacterized protein LOC123549807 n=1 Tax=Mercenaria mercenaria TaxID=6596 RepID=UPI001E1D5F2A|nr:uncharacterized protein LOC123549807 [Mercenaria mercenaria]XP_045194158.1 uncharacterized protein LOC123549807 [Mercenaria mercenaria]XP_045194159.1 uncharacterized protein LOC123549807 [Mercenaria mercenaria]XP_045194160.1 uncharacterized protein LOC123549807 [Mercenaria mercenaria]XP_045194161.1 uncharacterized protein LOC123549807 [Mercenaria mercenaria]XP_053400988.1 uncharacterized protein LOC123549807 [Mercenaria mercenaria]XP_053400989.1 uncharacterized protein LOC123549807 [Mercen
MGSLVPTIFFLIAGTSLILATPNCDETCILANQFEVNVEVDGNEISLSWKFNQSKQIYGFQVKIYNTDDSTLYESPILHVSQRAMKLEEELDGKSKICITAFENSTKVLDEKCEKIEIKDLKIVIGILAGTIFLIPCLLALSYVIFKDYKVRQLENYEKISPILDRGKGIAYEEDIIVDEVKKTPIQGTNATDSDDTKVNKAFVMNEDLKQSGDAEQDISESLQETAVVNTSNKVTANIENENSGQSNIPNGNSESLSESLDDEGQKIENSNKYEDSVKVRDSDKFEVVTESEIPTVEIPTVSVTDEEVLGTSL